LRRGNRAATFSDLIEFLNFVKKINVPGTFIISDQRPPGLSRRQGAVRTFSGRTAKLGCGSLAPIRGCNLLLKIEVTFRCRDAGPAAAICPRDEQRMVGLSVVYLNCPNFWYI